MGKIKIILLIFFCNFLNASKAIKTSSLKKLRLSTDYNNTPQIKFERHISDIVSFLLHEVEDPNQMIRWSDSYAVCGQYLFEYDDLAPGELKLRPLTIAVMIESDYMVANLLARGATLDYCEKNYDGFALEQIVDLAIKFYEENHARFYNKKRYFYNKETGYAHLLNIRRLIVQQKKEQSDAMKEFLKCVGVLANTGSVQLPDVPVVQRAKIQPRTGCC